MDFSFRETVSHMSFDFLAFVSSESLIKAQDLQVLIANNIVCRNNSYSSVGTA